MSLLKGLLIGFSIAAPVGPIGILCIRRTLRSGKFSGILSGLGAACADSLFGFIALLGLTALTEFLLGMQNWLQLVGGLFLLFLGWTIIRSKPVDSKGALIERNAPWRDFFSTFFLTLTNPLTILSFMGVIAGIGFGDSSVMLITGIFLGSMLWWLILTFGISSLRGKLSSGKLTFINWTSGLTIVAMGSFSLLYAFFRHFS